MSNIILNSDSVPYYCANYIFCINFRTFTTTDAYLFSFYGTFSDAAIDKGTEIIYRKILKILAYSVDWKYHDDYTA